MKKIRTIAILLIVITSMVMGCGKSESKNEKSKVDRYQEEETERDESDNDDRDENVEERNDDDNREEDIEERNDDDDREEDIEERNGDYNRDEKEQAKAYYVYLKEEILPDDKIQGEIVPSTPYKTTLSREKKDMYGWDVWRDGYTGLISAFIEDFDNDKQLEMLTVSLRYSNTIDTVYGDVYFEPGTPFDENSTKYCCIELICKVYDRNEDGEIEAVCSYPYAIMPTDSFGRMLVGVEKVDKEYYLFGYATSENLSTYGPKHFVAGNLTKGIEGKSIQWQYSSPLEYGRAHAGNYNEILHIYAPITINDTSLSMLKLEPEPDLGTRLIARVDFEYVQSDNKVEWDKVIMTPTDNTNLSTHIESDGETWERIELPQGGKIEVPEDKSAEMRFEEIIEEINRVSGTVFKQTDVREENEKFMCTYVSDLGNKVYLTWNMSKGYLSGIEISGNRGEEWIAAKDVLARLPELEFNSENEALFTGEVEDWLTYTNGIDIGEWKVSLFSVMEDTFRAYR